MWRNLFVCLLLAALAADNRRAQELKWHEHQGFATNENIIWEGQLGTLTECKRRCLLDTSCVAISFGNGDYCHVHSSTSGLISRRDWSVFVKQQNQSAVSKLPAKSSGTTCACCKDEAKGSVKSYIWDCRLDTDGDTRDRRTVEVEMGTVVHVKSLNCQHAYTTAVNGGAAITPYSLKASISFTGPVTFVVKGNVEKLHAYIAGVHGFLWKFHFKATGCWIRMPTGCKKALSETSTPTQWFVDKNSPDGSACTARSVAFNKLCGKSDATFRWGSQPQCDECDAGTTCECDTDATATDTTCHDDTTSQQNQQQPRPRASTGSGSRGYASILLTVVILWPSPYL